MLVRVAILDKVEDNLCKALLLNMARGTTISRTNRKKKTTMTREQVTLHLSQQEE